MRNKEIKSKRPPGDLKKSRQLFEKIAEWCIVHGIVQGTVPDLCICKETLTSLPNDSTLGGVEVKRGRKFRRMIFERTIHYPLFDENPKNGIIAEFVENKVSGIISGSCGGTVLITVALFLYNVGDSGWALWGEYLDIMLGDKHIEIRWAAEHAPIFCTRIK